MYQKMRIIPVIDILNSKVVHGIQGERDKYYPIKSVISNSANIIDIIDKFVNLFGFKELYIADLDAITKNIENFNYLNEILKIYDIDIMIDAGISNIKRARKILVHNIKNLIIGTETLTSVNFIKELQSVLKNDQTNLIISVDLYKNNNISKCKEIKGLNALEIIKYFEQFDINEFIILDLFRVGSKLGGVSEIIYEIINETNSKIITGGGINSIKDIQNLIKIQVDGVLIATALHNGAITPSEINSFLEKYGT